MEKEAFKRFVCLFVCVCVSDFQEYNRGLKGKRGKQRRSRKQQLCKLKNQRTRNSQLSTIPNFTFLFTLLSVSHASFIRMIFRYIQILCV